MMQAYINSLISRAKDLIKNNNSVLLRSGLLIVACVMVITTALLVVEFFYFRRQTAKMMEMKEDYRNYALAVKKILNDYHKTKERLEELETVLE
jgi:cell division protein ZapA (FtsZ GTPase activity inhibitor)